MGKSNYYLIKLTNFAIICVVIMLIIELFACTKTAVAPSNPTSPSISTPTNHKVKYVLFADPAQRAKGAYIDSAGRTVTFDSWDKKLDTINGVGPMVLDSEGWHSLNANFQIKIGSVDIDKGAYIKASGVGYPSTSFTVAICKDSVLNGETCFVVKKIGYGSQVNSNVELSYIVR